MSKGMGQCSLMPPERQGMRTTHGFGADMREPAQYPPVLWEQLQLRVWLCSKLCPSLLGLELRQGRKMSI